MKLTLSLMALALFFSFGVSETGAAGPAMSAKDTCGFSATKSATVNLNTNTSCEVTGLTGFTGGDLNITGASTIVTIRSGGKLVLDPGKWINIIPPKGQIRVETGGLTDAIVHGTLCILDNDGDGYANNNASFVLVPPDASKNKQLCSVLGGGYVEKKDLASLTEYDCVDGDGSKHDCCTTGYKDYDKDGDGAGAQGCYPADASYNVVANANDCNDSSASVKNGSTMGTFCGIGGCGGSGTDTCSNGTWVHTAPCTPSTKQCCDAVGNYKGAQTPISTCLKCNGSAADPVNQTSSEDLNNVCSGTACQSANCSGSGDSCGYVANGTVCRADSGGAGCDVAETCTGSSYVCPIDAFKTNSTIIATATAASGSCQLSGTKCTGTSNATAPYYVYASTANTVWNGSSWVAPTTSVNCNITGYQCSGQQIYRNYYGCAAGSNTCNASNTSNSTLCTGITGESNSRCIAGSSTCAAQCSDTTDNDGDGWVDSLDKGCNASACEQCKPSDGPCCDSNGCFKSSATTCNASVSSCDAEEKCTGSSAICPGDSKCAAGKIWNGSACVDGYCSDPGCGAATGANKSCTTSYNKQSCSGTSNACNGSLTPTTCYAPTAGNIWNGSAWVMASCTTYYGALTPSSCSGQTAQGSAYGCTTSGTQDTTIRATCSTGVVCSGNENDMCQGGICISKCVQTNPSYPGDDNGNGYTDAQEGVCGGGGQCNTGACCDTSTGTYRSSSYVCKASAGICDAAEKCTGSSNLCPGDSVDTKCAAGTYWNGTACVAGYCSDPGCGAATGTSGACSTSYNKQSCSGTANTCTGATTPTSCYAPAIGNIWNGSSWVSATCSLSTSAGSAYTCSGLTTIQRSAYGCNTSGGVDTSTAKATCSSGYTYWTGSIYNNGTSAAWSATTCSGNEASMCVAGNASCVNNCTPGGSSQSGSRYSDNQNADCPYGGKSKCISADGTCCNTAIGDYLPSNATCLTGAFNNPAAGSCQRTATNQYCPGNSAVCNGSTYTVYEYAPSNNNVWNGSVWAPASTTNTCRALNSTCSGNTQINNAYYGCTVGSNACNGSAAGTATVSCTGQENDMCVAGNSSCQNKCTHGVDDNGNGFIDDQDGYCPGGYGQCTSGACCNTSNGSYSSSGTTCRASAGPCDITETCSGTSASCPSNTYCPANQVWNGTTCVVGVCSTGSCGGPNLADSGNPCTFSYYHLRCSGTSADCSGAGMFGGSCNCPAGTTWNNGSKTCTANNCGTNSSYCYSTTQYASNYLKCNGSGSCNTDTGTVANGPYSCGTYYAGKPYCTGSASCVECTTRTPHCPADAWVGSTSCSGTNVVQTWRVYSCSSNVCTYYDNLNTVKSSCGSGSQICSGGACVSCSAGTYYNNGSCSTCPAGQYCTGGAASPQSCSSGTYSSGGASSCSTCSAGSYNQSTGQTSCSQCPANYYCTGGSNLSYCGTNYTSPAGSTSSGSCTAITCGSGYYVNNGSCTACAAGTYKSGTNSATSCSSCSAGTYNTSTGNSGCTTCEAGYYCLGGSFHSQCSAGTYNTTTGNSSCTTCPCGSYCIGGSNTYPCPAGYYCDTGTLNGADAHICPIGTYSVSGQCSCTACPKGTYSSSQGTAFNCTSCASGYTTATTGATSASACYKAGS